MNKIRHKSTSGTPIPDSDMSTLRTNPPQKPDPGTDKEFFIRQAFEKNAAAGYELLFRHYYGTLCSHAVRFVYTREAAEDLVADVFYSFWKKESFRHVSTSYRAYLFTAVRHKCFNYLRWEFIKENGEDLKESTALSSLPQPDHVMEYDELCNRLERTIESLPPQCRRVFLMNRFEGKNYTEIAENMGVSVKAIEAHISKALSIFRKVLLNHYRHGIVILLSLFT